MTETLSFSDDSKSANYLNVQQHVFHVFCIAHKYSTHETKYEKTIKVWLELPNIDRIWWNIESYSVQVSTQNFKLLYTLTELLPKEWFYFSFGHCICVTKDFKTCL